MSEAESVRCGPYEIVAQRPGTLLTGPGGDVELRAEDPYLVRLDSGADRTALRGALEVPVGGREGTLRFGNFIGTTSLGGRRLVVGSTRLGPGAVETMLAAVEEQLAALPFASLTPTAAGYERVLLERGDILYHRFAVVRDAMRGVGRHDLPAAMARILGMPYERLATVSRDLPLGRVDRFDGATVVEILSRPDRLVGVSPGTALGGLAATRLLAGRLPATVRTTRAEPDTDNLENAFVAAVVDVCADVCRRIERLALDHGTAGGAALAGEARGYAGALAAWRGHPVLDGLPAARSLPLQSTVLRGRAGYREATAFFIDLIGATRRLDTDDLRRMLELRDAALLYEYWCFFEVVRAVGALHAVAPEWPEIDVRPFGANLPQGQFADVGDLRIWFNRTYPAGAGDARSYSVQLRPDVSIEHADGTLDLLDAKLKRDFARAASDDEEAEVADRFRRSDLYKMHAYRDAIGARSVWILYPGETEGVQQYTAPDGTGGVGAVPLRPGGPTADLRAALAAITLGTGEPPG